VIRRRAALLFALPGVLALAGCGTFDDNDAAATVGDGEVSRDEFEAALAALTAVPASQVVADPVTGTVSGDPGRDLLSAMVRGTANEQFLAAAGESITEADREAVLESVPDDDPVFDLPDDVVNLLVDLSAAATARGRVAAPEAAELERMYADSPAGLGAVCALHIVVDSESEAQDVLAELEGGADFGELAAERSTDPAAADTGGTMGGECVPLTALAQAGPQFLAAVEASTIGVPTDPLQTTLGWHVVVRRPYDEVAEPLAALFAEQAGELMFAGYLASADVQVDPRYGRWDSLTSAVVAL
jgi:peptidyl-prolyl cis-trans isomerase C